jgi:hypothetical protein
VLGRVTRSDERVPAGMMLFLGDHKRGYVGGHRQFLCSAVDIHSRGECRHCPDDQGILRLGPHRAAAASPVEFAPQAAPLVLALSNTATYTGLACSAVLGRLMLLFIDRHYLSIVGAGLTTVGFVLSEAAYRYRESGPGTEPARHLQRRNSWPRATRPVLLWNFLWESLREGLRQ